MSPPFVKVDCVQGARLSFDNHEPIGRIMLEQPEQLRLGAARLANGNVSKINQPLENRCITRHNHVRRKPNTISARPNRRVQSTYRHGPFFDEAWLALEYQRLTVPDVPRRDSPDNRENMKRKKPAHHRLRPERLNSYICNPAVELRNHPRSDNLHGAPHPPLGVDGLAALFCFHPGAKPDFTRSLHFADFVRVMHACNRSFVFTQMSLHKPSHGARLIAEPSTRRSGSRRFPYHRWRATKSG